jgi:hypothetical protein
MSQTTAVVEKSGWISKINKVVSILAAIASALTTIIGFIQKLALDSNPAASPEQVSEATDVMGWGVVGLAIAAALYFGGQYIPMAWGFFRTKFRASTLDPKTKAKVRRFVADNCLEGLRGVFEGDLEAEDRIRWLAQRASQLEIDLKFPAPAKGALPTSV